MASFQAKIVWKRPRKREKKNYCFVMFLTDAVQKIAKKLQKSKKIPLWHHFKPKQFGKGQEREKTKIIVSFRSYLTRYIKFQKIAIKFKKKKKYHYGFISSQNRQKEDEKERK